ncbi:hypothetical protein D1227_08325 [Henriciella mobilis]|uniref:phosphotransferase n=1 Tax=Henriciella mobilis TaxID=2305467 RepID=UPI000E674C3D|nr:phosphotransferase [Henriciella mobilis]RIJ17249.1 hypothetical protein D1231_05245 [Henriciella mobilis]RIJ22404.1 hypothetical protein D1227_08325 [Henriciella mobilis]
MSPELLEALHREALDRLEVADMAAAHARSLDIEEVHTAEKISSEWLGHVIGGNVDGALLENAVQKEGHDGMTDRRQWNLSWNAQGRAAGLPASVFIKATPSQPYLRETLSMLHMAEAEVRFYNELRDEIPHLAPQSFYGKSWAGGRFILVLEALEDRGLKPYWMHHDCSFEHACAVLEALAELHARYWETDRFQTDLAWVRPRALKFGARWHEASFVQARSAYLQTDLGQALPEDIRALLGTWSEVFRNVYAWWDSQPLTLIHGDSHLGNSFAYPDGKAGMFDWQVVFRSHAMRDVAYFVLSALTRDQRAEFEDKLISSYLMSLQRHGVKLEEDYARRLYALFLLDSWDAHMKTYTRGGYGHADAAVRRRATTMIDALREHQTADLLGDLLKEIGG